MSRNTILKHYNMVCVPTAIELFTRDVHGALMKVFLKSSSVFFFFLRTCYFKTSLYTKVHFLNVLIYRFFRTWDNNIYILYRDYKVGGLRLGERIETDDQRPRSPRACVHLVSLYFVTLFLVFIFPTHQGDHLVLKSVHKYTATVKYTCPCRKHRRSCVKCIPLVDQIRRGRLMLHDLFVRVQVTVQQYL